METEKKLIMLVDDNPANLRIGKNVLTADYTVATAPSAAKLFNLLENNKPALILLDIDMPDMDGYEALSILKEKPETRDIPVIFLTGMAAEQDEEKGRTLGAVDYITKPFDPPVLLKCIEEHIL
jgi:CheY-like chemotaxis protein